MKRIILLTITLVFLILCACGGNLPTDNDGSGGKIPNTLETESSIHLDPDHQHTTVTEPQTVSDLYGGYCGNTMTTVNVDGKEYSFMGGDSVYITDLLLNLDYDVNKICKCPSEYNVDTEFGTWYGVNLSQGFVRCDKGQAELTAEQVDRLQKILYNIVRN